MDVKEKLIEILRKPIFPHELADPIEAVAELLVPYLSDISRNTKETAEKEMSVNIGDKDIARANARGKRMLGYQLVT